VDIAEESVRITVPNPRIKTKKQIRISDVNIRKIIKQDGRIGRSNKVLYSLLRS
jgi:hypothetical protein